MYYAYAAAAAAACATKTIAPSAFATRPVIVGFPKADFLIFKHYTIYAPCFFFFFLYERVLFFSRYFENSPKKKKKHLNSSLISISP